MDPRWTPPETNCGNWEANTTSGPQMRISTWQSWPAVWPMIAGPDRSPRSWELTQRGQEWAEAMPYCRHGHSGYQILWNPAVVEILRELV
jgi:hypothetical protein